MLNINLICVIITILAENGETRALTLIKLINKYINNISVREPLVFEHIPDSYTETSLPLSGAETDWGDGQITDSRKHIYRYSYRKYRVKVYSSDFICSLYIRWPGNIYRFISIGRIGIISLRFLFLDNKYNFIIDPNWETSEITDMFGVFYDTIKFNRKFGDNWDTSNVTNMGRMFCGAQNFNQKIGDNWNTSQVTDMGYMFCGAISFNQKIGDNWDTSNVITMNHMFRNAINFNQKIGDNWDTSQVTDMSYMFCNASSFNQKIGDNWDTSRVVTLRSMFNGADKLTQKIGFNWNVSRVVDMNYMFSAEDNNMHLPIWYVS